MPGRVIQGYFAGGTPRLPHAAPPMAQPAAPTPPGPRPHAPPPTKFGPSIPAAQPKLVTRPQGPQAPAHQAHTSVAQRHAGSGAFAVDPVRLSLAGGGGRPLPDAVRGRMESALGADFSGVRVHVGPQAERIGAIAFTLGNDIYFAPGRYQPDTAHGQQLLGHELAHVVQQRQGRVRNPLGGSLAVVQDGTLEAEADRAAARVARLVPRDARPALASPAAQPKQFASHPPGPPAPAHTAPAPAVPRHKALLGRHATIARARRLPIQCADFRLYLTLDKETQLYKDQNGNFYNLSGINKKQRPSYYDRIKQGTPFEPGELADALLTEEDLNASSSSDSDDEGGAKIHTAFEVGRVSFFADGGYETDSESPHTLNGENVIFYHATSHSYKDTVLQKPLDEKKGKGEFGAGFYCTRTLEDAMDIAKEYKFSDPDPLKNGKPWCVISFTVPRAAFKKHSYLEATKEDWSGTKLYEKQELIGTGIVRGPTKNPNWVRQYKFEGQALAVLSKKATRKLETTNL